MTNDTPNNEAVARNVQHGRQQGPAGRSKRAERGSARRAILDAVRDLVREKGYEAMTVDDICRRAGVTKGAFFHHFASKEALGVAAALDWFEITGVLFANAPYHAPEDPLERVLAYIRFRRDLIAGGIAEFTCVAGTMVQEVHDTSPAIREACGEAIFGHAQTLVADISAAKARYAPKANWDPEGLARYTQAALQGGFILAKAGDNPGYAVEAVDHLYRYVALLFAEESAEQEAGNV